MIPSKIKTLIDKYCMGIVPSDEQMDEIMDLVVILNADQTEVSAYIKEKISGPTKEEIEAAANAEAARKAAEDEKKRLAEEEKRRKEEEKQKKEEEKRKAEEAERRKAEEKAKIEEAKQKKVEEKRLRTEALNGTANGHKYIDLGLPSGLKWASCNIGTTKPEGDGKYFSWGEAKERSPFASSWEDYTFHTKKGLITKKDVMTKYNEKDKLTVLDGIDDTATILWKGKWRIPTLGEYKELISHCKSKWVKINDIRGRQFTGPNGNSIFLPCCGEFDERRWVPFGAYWSSSLCSGSQDEVQFAQIIWFDSKSVNEGNKYRYTGLHIRPVID